VRWKVAQPVTGKYTRRVFGPKESGEPHSVPPTAGKLHLWPYGGFDTARPTSRKVRMYDWPQAGGAWLMGGNGVRLHACSTELAGMVRFYPPLFDDSFEAARDK
jgi:hypothetical protein